MHLSVLGFILKDKYYNFLDLTTTFSLLICSLASNNLFLQMIFTSFKLNIILIVISYLIWIPSKCDFFQIFAQISLDIHFYKLLANFLRTFFCLKIINFINFFRLYLISLIHACISSNYIYGEFISFY